LLFELGVERGLKQADISRQIGEYLRQDEWPLIQVNGADPHNFDKVITRILGQHSS
ncbi:MAG: sulfate adenylyltransferase, partial [Mesorhizobium sp.]